MLATYIFVGCQSKYQDLVSAIKLHDKEKVVNLLDEGLNGVTEEEFSPIYYAIEHYNNDKDGLEMMQLVHRYKVKSEDSLLLKLCHKKENILERTNYLITRGEDLYRYWNTCKKHNDVYDYYQTEMKVIEESKEAIKEARIAIYKKILIKKGLVFRASSYSSTVTNIEKGKTLGEVIAHSTRIDRINTGTFEFHGIFNISEGTKAFVIGENTTFYIRDERAKEFLKQEQAKEVFYETMSKPSSYYIFEWDKENILTEIRQFNNHIYYTAKELHGK
ncbi:MAG TPA: hypothetical protein EYG83_00005 [Sulfurospirillum arcachonense]|nr:hypothetical protein [Sulfurospirillum arcachonense]